MGALLSVLPYLNTALSVIGSFSGNAQAAKISGAVQDAVSVVGALTPLFQKRASGEEVTQADVDAALAGKDSAIKGLDDLIAAKGG